jgi:hypothetical protein
MMPGYEAPQSGGIMRALRIAVVTAGLMAAGAVCGGVAGSITGAVWILLYAVHPDTLQFMALVGGVLGVLLGPAAAWLLMRHVPLWLALGGTTLGTTAGGVAGILFGAPGLMVIAALTGFAVSVICLRLETPLDGRLSRDSGAGRLPAGGG